MGLILLAWVFGVVGIVTFLFGGGLGVEYVGGGVGSNDSEKEGTGGGEGGGGKLEVKALNEWVS